ncbi:type I-C CRISPR-associated endonuclease Cas1c [Ruminococcus sp.]|uniref:type I-C CRISPR-associated endonuclease Cas1c n=1 Tax=Ruminococcus sp. TaxID=41978 RepID=UPI0025E5486A|nr:type I-C CRISPR-associated endonuclease Cas1c [Ruminococcus sp.]
MKKLLNSLYILDETAWLTLDGENIVCKCEDKEKFRLPFVNIGDIYCFSYLGCSPALIGKCADTGVKISFISPSGKYLASVCGKTKGNIFLRKAQFEQLAKPDILLAQNTVAAKLSNTRFLIRRSMRDNPQLDSDGELSRCIEYLESGMEHVYELNDTETIMGLEGSCAKSYFNIFDKLILHQKDDFYVTARIKRPPLDPVNAVLSFLYTIMTSWYASALESVGLDSCYGFYHALRSGRSSLACDLVEEVRCIAERLTLTLINLKKINISDFEKQESGAVYLTKEGKKKVLSAWQEKKRTSIVHPYLNEKITLGILPFVQSSLLAKYFRGEIEEYPCFIMK